MNCSKITNKGRIRKINEDAIFMSAKNINSLDNLFIVADGVGGNQKGEIASNLSIKSFVKYIKDNKEDIDVKTLLHEAYKYSEDELFKKAESKEKYKGMCTTFLVASIKNNILHILNIGDSRLYLMTKYNLVNANGEKIERRMVDQITRDNTEIVEERIIPDKDIKEIAKDNNIDQDTILDVAIRKRKFLTKALGSQKNSNADYYEIDLNKKIEDGKDIIILLCTDGLYNLVSDDEMMNVSYDDQIKFKDKTKVLVKKAIKLGGTDNVSAIMIEI